MNRRYFIFVGIVVFLIIVIFWLFHNREQSSQVLPTPIDKGNAFTANGNSKPTSNTRQTNENVGGLPASTQSVSNGITLTVTEEKMRADIEAKNVPLDFYGRVIDQDTNGLSGVSIAIRVRHWNTESFGSVPIERETDSNGRFDIHDVTGDAFDIESMGKEGYELEPNTKRAYGATGGSVNDPVLFTMWGTNIHEQLITGEKSFQIVPDGRPYFIDLTKGTIAESGDADLKVWVNRPNQIVYGKSYDWSSETDVMNGGLLAETDSSSSMYLAPIDGYTPSFQFEQKIGSGWGNSTGEKRFYIRLNNGLKYGRFTIEMMSYYNDQIPGMIRISYVLNPSGSRILR